MKRPAYCKYCRSKERTGSSRPASFLDPLITSLDSHARWSHLLVGPNPTIHEAEIHQFYKSLKVNDDDTVVTTAKGKKIRFTVEELRNILDVPSMGYDEYIKKKWVEYGAEKSKVFLTAKFGQGRKTEAARKVLKGEITPDHKQMHLA
ncbi:hypothetical protein RND71_032043 [Anisodus tanguticus]|uniref:Uncharacterized protein n=1 Tax=Anisodus tanguticus TaxID=243964 RepID=A0AAE1RCY6_9SOLA|nr:hypothetical protein RND71_032043 [Anisodus tanguticus]